MGLLTNIKNYRTRKRVERLRGDLTMIIKTDYTFDPFKIALPPEVTNQKNKIAEIAENLIWYLGKPAAISNFYKTSQYVSVGGDKNSFFWATAPANLRKVHSGIGRMVSNEMSNILFGKGIDINTTVYKENEEHSSYDSKVDKAKSKIAKETIDNLFSKTMMSTVLEKAAKVESWGGHVAIKMSYNIALSSYPILEVIDRRYFDVIKDRGITQAIVFNYYYEKEKTKERFVFKEVYTVNNEGHSVIRNELYKVLHDGKLERISLLRYSEVTGKVLQVELQDEITFDTYGILAFEKPNRESCGDIPDFPYGESDYSTAYSTFDGLDEILSQIVAEIRDNKTLRVFPKEFFKSADDGLLEFDKYITNYLLTEGDLDVLKNNPQASQSMMMTAPDKTDSLFLKYKILIGQACNQCGLSPLSLGITGLESINSSDKSTRERSKKTTETRNDKIKLWKPFLEEMIIKVLEFTSYLQSSYPEIVTREGIRKIDIDTQNCDIDVTFPDYINDSEEEKLTTWGAAKTAGIASLEMVVEKVHGDNLSEEEKLLEVQRIKFEQGISFDNPNLLQLTGEDEDDKDDENNPPGNKDKEKGSNNSNDGKSILEILTGGKKKENEVDVK